MSRKCGSWLGRTTIGFEQQLRARVAELRSGRAPCVAAVIVCSACSQTTDAESPQRELAVELGEQQTLLGPEKAGFLPDEALCVVRKTPDVALVAGAKSSVLLVGPSLEALEVVGTVLQPGPDAYDAGYAGISGCQHLGDGTLFAIYHAEDNDGLQQLPGGLPGYYASIAAATSIDGGKTWQKLGPIVTSNKPKEWAAYPEHGDRGVATPSLVLDPDKEFLYLYYDDHSRVMDGRVTIGVARASYSNGVPGPGAWTKYHEGEFSQPGLGGLETPVLEMVDTETDPIQAHVVHSADLDTYVMVVGVVPVAEYVYGAPLDRMGTYIAHSADGIVWSEPEQLLRDYSVPAEGHSLSWEATVVWDVDTSSEGWLVYGFTPSWPNPAPYMVARRLTLYWQ